MRFARKRGGRVAVKAEPVEAAVLASAVSDLVALLEEGPAAPEVGQPGPAAGRPAPGTGRPLAEEDPLAAMVGLPPGDVQRPDDPALARLLPDAYGDDEAAAAEFRRYTQSDLRAGKRRAAQAVLAELTPIAGSGGSLVLDRPRADAWLTCLNDLRLVLGVRLDVTEETDLDPPGDDPRSAALHVYGWLGWLQEQLLSCLDPVPPGR